MTDDGQGQALSRRARRGLRRRTTVAFHGFKAWAFAPGWPLQLTLTGASVGLLMFPLWVVGWKYGVLGTLLWVTVAAAKAWRELSPKNMQLFQRGYLHRKLLLYKLLQQMEGPTNASLLDVRMFQQDALSLIANYVRDHRADVKGTVVFANLLIPAADDPESLVVITRDREHLDRQTPSKVAIADTVVGEAFTAGREVICGDIYKEFPDTVPGKPYRSVLAIPVKRRGRILGVVSIDSSRRYHFDGDAENLTSYVNPYIALLAWTLDRGR